MDRNIQKMYGIFASIGIIAGIASGILVDFYRQIVKDQTLQEQMRLSSIIMINYGFGCLVGGYIISFTNDRMGGGRSVSKACLVINAMTFSLLVVCNIIHQYNYLCFASAFTLGAANTALNT